MTVSRTRVIPAFVAIVLLTGPLALVASAQNEPVYPVYDGFLVTDEGLHVLSFAYFSHNFEPVTVPVGPLNSFGPDPADRQQATTFLPGHQRFQCIVVMGSDFTGGLRWTLDHAGTKSTTSADMLQYNWELEVGSARAVLRDVEPAEAPRGVCLNRTPTIRFLGLRNGPGGAPPEVTASVGSELKLFGSVRDEGLPRAGALVSRWRMLTGPGTVTFSAPGEPRTLASFDTPGDYELELWASDGERESASRVAVAVDPAPSR
ncbi:MAG: hypothetical protein QF681_01840 [Vicinamibacterales bacterium]|jgi:hypothetical protein|nr:hypothetical protein [Vicinamibacterales bacterium]